MPHPIWKDYVVTLSQDDATDFRIFLAGGAVIYTGRSYKRPGETDNTIRINDICADFLTHAVPALSQAEFTALTFPLEFYTAIWDSVAEDWVDVDVVEFLNDWSYEYGYDPVTMGMAFPINGRIDARMWLTYTAYNVADITATLYMEDGTSQVVTIPLQISADFNGSFNEDFSRSVHAAGSGTAVFDLSAWSNPDVVAVDINGTLYEVVTDCAAYALYYLNAYGGWDCLLVEGAFEEADNLTRMTSKRDYDNADIRNRGTRNYVNVIDKTFTLNTGWLSEDASLRMHHLLNSTDVYLYDIAAGQMIPVTIVDTATAYRRHRTRKAINYTFTVSVAQERLRR